MSKLRIALVLLGDVMLCTALVLLTQIDKLVNSTLYSYGLTFDDAWAQPYWLMLRVCMISLVAAIILISLVELPHPAFEERTDEVKQSEEKTEYEEVGLLQPATDLTVEREATQLSVVPLELTEDEEQKKQ